MVCTNGQSILCWTFDALRCIWAENLRPQFRYILGQLRPLWLLTNHCRLSRPMMHNAINNGNLSSLTCFIFQHLMKYDKSNQKQKHCQRHNGPMGWDHNWRHLIASKFSKHKQMVPHAFAVCPSGPSRRAFVEKSPSKARIFVILPVYMWFWARSEGIHHQEPAWELLLTFRWSFERLNISIHLSLWCPPWPA